MLRNRTALWALVTALLCVVLLAAGWFLLVGPRLSEAVSLREEKAATQLSNDEQRAHIRQLQVQYAQLSTTKAELASVREQIPGVTGMPQVVRSLNTIAEATGVVLDAVTPGQGQALDSGTSSGTSGTSGTSSGTSGSSGTSSGSSGTSSGSSGTSSGSSGTSSGSSGTSSGSVSGVVGVPLTITVHGDYFQIVAFTQKLQTQLKRAVLVNALQLSEETSATGDSVDGMQAIVTGAIFVLPDGGSSTSGTSDTSSGTASGTTDTSTPTATGTSTSRTTS